ncbi:hypothetical protein [Pseudoxanthomonas wuyuanensis]
MDPNDVRMRDVIAELERVLAMPEGASDLRGYTRYYSESSSGRLQGIFILDGDGGVHIVPPEKLPRIFDGGCSVVRLEYEMPTKQVVSISCAGSA